MSQLHKASPDCIAFVEQIGIKLRNVVPNYQTRVLGSIHSDSLPQAHSARAWLKTYMKVHNRFAGIKDDGTPEPKGRQYVITENEIHAVASLAQWLIGLHAEAEYAASGLPRRVQSLEVRIEDMIVREKITV